MFILELNEMLFLIAINLTNKSSGSKLMGHDPFIEEKKTFIEKKIFNKHFLFIILEKGIFYTDSTMQK